MLSSLVRRAWFGAPDSAPVGSPVARRGARIRETFGRAHRNMALTDVAFDEVLVAAAVEQRLARTPVEPAEDGLAALPCDEAEIARLRRLGRGPPQFGAVTIEIAAVAERNRGGRRLYGQAEAARPQRKSTRLNSSH